MKKIREVENKVKNIKIYKLSEDEKITDLLVKLRDSFVEIQTIEVFETIEGGKNNIDGTYSLDQLISEYDRIAKFDDDKNDIYISILGKIVEDEIIIQLFPEDNRVALGTDYKDMELTDILV